MNKNGLFSLAFLSVFAQAETLEATVDNFSIRDFSDLESMIDLNSIGGISLVELRDAPIDGELDISKSNEELKYDLTINKYKDEHENNKVTAGIYLNIGGKCCEQFGVSYEKSVKRLSAVAAKLGATKMPKGDPHFPTGDQYGVKWEWTANKYKCDMMIENEKYFTGGLHIKCLYEE